MDFKSKDFREADRPDHPDFMDASELKKIEFTGVRHNSLDDSIEMWLVGERKFYVSVAERQLDPEAFQKKYKELFNLEHVDFLPTQGN